MRAHRPRGAVRRLCRTYGDAAVSATIRRAPRTDSPSGAEAFARRTRRTRRRRWRPALAALLALTVVAGANWLVLESSVLAVREVRVTGTDKLAVTDVLAAATVVDGTPLARVDLDAARARVAALPRVADVEVARDWPRGVTISVRERVPAALVPDGDVFRVVDVSGVAFDRAEKPVKGLPVVTVSGQRAAEALTAALSVLDALPPALHAQVRTVEADSPENVRLAMGKGRTVAWGNADRSARKALVLGALMTQKAKIYDVSAPDAPTTR